VRICADDTLSGCYDASFRQNGVLYAAFALDHVVGETLLSGKVLNVSGILSGFDVLIGGKVVGNQHYLIFIEDLVSHLAENRKGHGAGDVVGHHHIQAAFDKLPGLYVIKSRMGCQNLLRHCHCHDWYSSLVLSDYSTKCIFLFILFSALTRALTAARMVSAWVPTPQ